MSKASDVRDAVLAAIDEELPDETVEAFIVPSFTREELASGPRVIVRVGGREFAIDQGVDETSVLIEVGVVGLAPKREDHSVEYRTEMLAVIDTFDHLMESVIALFINGGALSRAPMSNHWLNGASQIIQLDAQKFYADGIWLSVIQLTYRDSED